MKRPLHIHIKQMVAGICIFLFGALMPIMPLAFTSNLGAQGITYASSTTYYCGSASYKADTSIDIGCEHHGNPIEALTFAIIKLLSDGVGLVIIASLILAGIQFTSSRGEPQATATAIKRVRANLTALLMFIFAYALLNYLVPAGVLK
jgi:hypothetical protein